MYKLNCFVLHYFSWCTVTLTWVRCPTNEVTFGFVQGQRSFKSCTLFRAVGSFEEVDSDVLQACRGVCYLFFSMNSLTNEILKSIRTQRASSVTHRTFWLAIHNMTVFDLTGTHPPSLVSCIHWSQPRYSMKILLKDWIVSLLTRLLTCFLGVFVFSFFCMLLLMKAQLFDSW